MYSIFDLNNIKDGAVGMDEPEYKVVGKGILKAFWYGLLAFIIALTINFISPHNSGGWSELSKGIVMGIIILISGIYCLVCFIVALTEWLVNRKKSHVNLENAEIAMALHGIVAALVFFLMFAIT
ncbi:TPA: hypothetical protein U2I30_003751 [Providencia rettgeri]|nr:hypothetical protein [Providencia rettgeri]HEM6892271.1 hypothetical protein [Providencia rettgeri]